MGLEPQEDQQTTKTSPGESSTTTTTMVKDTKPFPFPMRQSELALIIIDMQRDFLLPGGFGESMGCDIGHMKNIVPALQSLLDACRKAGVTIIHTRESHTPDLADCPPAKRRRGNPPKRIGDEGPMGRILIRGEVRRV